MKKYSIVIVALVITIGIGIALFSIAPKQQESGTINNTTSKSNDATNSQQNPDQPSQTTPTVTRTDDEITAAIMQTEPGLVNSSTQKPSFSIVKKESPLTGWYVVIIRNNETDTSDASVVMTDVNGKLTVKAGPGTGLFNQKGLPQAVVDALLAQ